MILQKYSGAGNKFVMVNNLSGECDDRKNLVLKLCSDNTDADGVIFLEKSATADFKMNYFNKDGSGNTLCGNGLRCTVKYIDDNGISEKKSFMIESASHVFECRLLDDDTVAVRFPPPAMIKTNFKLKVHFQDWWQLLNCSYAYVGSPHIVVFIDEIEKPRVKSLEEIKICDWGRNIRMHKDLMPEGANVNFVRVSDPDRSVLEIRSYERGVEGETLACGTGAISSAIIFYVLRRPSSPIKLLTRSGEYLTVDIEANENKLQSILLIGKAERYK